MSKAIAAPGGESNFETDDGRTFAELTLQIELLFSYPEGLAQQALGHNGEAVHHAYAKPAEVTVRSLDDWEKKWRKREQRAGAVNLAGDSI